MLVLVLERELWVLVLEREMLVLVMERELLVLVMVVVSGELGKELFRRSLFYFFHFHHIQCLHMSSNLVFGPCLCMTQQYHTLLHQQCKTVSLYHMLHRSRHVPAAAALQQTLTPNVA
jgi:hypothetical protein